MRNGPHARNHARLPRKYLARMGSRRQHRRDLKRQGPFGFPIRRYSQIYLHRRLSEFLRQRFPDIELATEFEKELRIQALVRSGSFVDTHRSIARLSEYSDFTDQQARDLLEAAFRNSQIYRIAQDGDVQGFFQDLANTHANVLDEDEFESFHELFSPHDDAAELEEGWVDF